MSENAVVSVKTLPVNGPNGPANAMMISVNIGDPSTAEAFVSQVAEQFRLHRMMAPPDTSLLLITLIGELSAAQFANYWRQVQRTDEVVRTFMSTMVVGDVIQGTPEGVQLSRAALNPPG